MPSLGSSSFWEVDPRRWERCRRRATADMVASGWKTYARKFDEVMNHKARKLWASGS